MPAKLDTEKFNSSYIRPPIDEDILAGDRYDYEQNIWGYEEEEFWFDQTFPEDDNAPEVGTCQGCGGYGIAGKMCICNGEECGEYL